MLRYASLLAPLILRASSSTSTRMSIANLMLAYAFLFFGGVFGLTALYIWVSMTYGVLIACIAMCVTMLSIGVIILLSKNDVKVPKPGVPSTVEGDPLAKHIPDALKNDPRFQQALEKIGENPVAATAGAVTVGMILSRELTGD